MQALIEKFKAEGPQVIQNSDYLYKSDIKWKEDIPYEDPNQFEIDFNKDTKKPNELLEFEKVEEPIKSDKKRDLIDRIKVISLNRLGYYPLTNPSTFFQKDKDKLIEVMKECLELPEDILTQEFNEVCTTKIFLPNADYSLFTISK